MDIARETGLQLRAVNALFADIDDTISTDGLISREAFGALWDARESGLDVIPVTGRPAGWCDHIARMWPVKAVVGENGGFYFHMTAKGMRKVYMLDDQTRRADRDRLRAIRDQILRDVPGCAVASDQAYREYDLAIDYCEDVSPLPRAEVSRIVSIFREHGATAKVSSIHVNGWFGQFDKLSMVRRFVSDAYAVDLQTSVERFAFVGDSPNDEPMFAFFPLSFGVANVDRFLEDMTFKPAFVTTGAGGAGFAEVVAAILAAKAAPASVRSERRAEP